jgi:hypothetical protein
VITLARLRWRLFSSKPWRAFALAEIAQLPNTWRAKPDTVIDVDGNGRTRQSTIAQHSRELWNARTVVSGALPERLPRCRLVLPELPAILLKPSNARRRLRVVGQLA